MWRSVASGQNPPTTYLVPFISVFQGLTPVWSASLSSFWSEYQMQPWCLFLEEVKRCFCFERGHPVIMTSYPSREWWRRLLHRAFRPHRRTPMVSNSLWAWTTPAITRPPTRFSLLSEFEKHFTLIRQMGTMCLVFTSMTQQVHNVFTTLHFGCS